MTHRPPRCRLFPVSRALGWLVLILACCGNPRPVGAQHEPLPNGIVDSQDPRDVSSSPEEDVRRMTVPDGFVVTLFAGEPHVRQPIAFDFDDRGRLWVVECYSHPNWKPTGHDRVLIFEDQDGDGRFDKRIVFWDQGNYLSGIAWGHGGVFLCNTPNFIFIADQDRDDVPDAKPVVLLDGWDISGPHNVFNNLRFGPDGWLYGSIGQNRDSIVGPPGAPASARKRISRGFWRYHPVRQSFEVVALGAVNPWGLDFNEVGDGFFTNCVLPHLWHLIPGAYYQRRPGEKDNPHAYERIQPICDHRHWADGAWTDSRGAHGAHGSAGGGHAHTGAMIYLGGSWPETYRNTFFTGNLHGNRINNDSLRREGSSYVASHREDFLFGNDPWFRCLSQKYGPDGSAFITDWHDVGECHDSDGSHRSSGRIYRVSHGSPEPAVVGDLQALSNDRLVDLQWERNDWFVRHARRILQERANSSHDMTLVNRRLREMFASDQASVPQKLRALWALHATGGSIDDLLLAALDHTNEYVRSWAIRLLTDGVRTSAVAQARLVEMAPKETSSYVRLSLSAALPRLDEPQRWRLATGLAAHGEDADDRMLPLMIWYGIEPLIAMDPDRALRLLEACKIPRVQQHIARRLTESLE